MKRQKVHSRQVIIGITFFAALLTIASCKEGKGHVQHTAVSLTRVESIETGIHTSAMHGNTKVLKENTGPELIFNEKDPPGIYSPSFTPWMFLFFPFTPIITAGN